MRCRTLDFLIAIILGTWKQNISIGFQTDLAKKSFPNNTFGLVFFFSDNNKAHQVYLLPLNEHPPSQLKGRIASACLFFERMLIEEDDIEYALDVLSLFKQNPDQRLVLQDQQKEELMQVLHFIANEYEKEKANYQIVKSLLKVVLLKLIEVHQSNLAPQDLQQNRVYQFLNLMETHYKSQPQAHFYAQQMGISVKRLNQILSEKLSLTATQILKQRILTEVKRELQRKDKSIKEIAFDFQFNSVSSFSRFFKRYTNRSPKEFNLLGE